MFDFDNKSNVFIYIHIYIISFDKIVLQSSKYNNPVVSSLFKTIITLMTLLKRMEKPTTTKDVNCNQIEFKNCISLFYFT